MSSTTRTGTCSVRFANMAQMFIVERHEDYGKKSNNVARHELWYTTPEVHSMRRAIERDVLQVRAQALTGAPITYAGHNIASADESSVCCIGIEHLLTAEIMIEMEACRARCIQAVLAEQARQGPSARLGWEAIALASFAQTRKVALRARKFGQLQQDSI
jgi:hypothetical protein